MIIRVQGSNYNNQIVIIYHIILEVITIQYQI